MWLQKYRPRSLTVDDTPYELSFSDKEVSLEFGVKLDRFQIGYYPGERRPRSFTSHITIVDPASGGTQSEVISMNNPAKYGGYTFYQSSYRLGKDRAASFLSVARDPGLPVVYTGYIAVMTGMVMVLIRRMTDFRRTARQTSREEGRKG
jgi:cytochrome c biogenesis protein ResB